MLRIRASWFSGAGRFRVRDKSTNVSRFVFWVRGLRLRKRDAAKFLEGI